MTETTTQRSMYAIIKIDVTKINKEWLFHGKNGKIARNTTPPKT